MGEIQKKKIIIIKIETKKWLWVKKKKIIKKLPTAITLGQ